MKKCDICGKTCSSTSNDIDQWDYNQLVDASGKDDLIFDFCDLCAELFKTILDNRLSKAAQFAEIADEVKKIAHPHLLQKSPESP